MRLVDVGLDAAVVVFFDFAAVAELVDLGLTATELDLGLVVGVDLTLVLDRTAVVVDFTLALDRTAVVVGLVLDLEEEARVVFALLEVADLVLITAAVFETVVLRLALLVGASGIEFCGGWSRLAMTGISSDFSSWGEGLLPLVRHFAGLSAHASM